MQGVAKSKILIDVIRQTDVLLWRAWSGKSDLPTTIYATLTSQLLHFSNTLCASGAS
jgi:hypothetical protein